MKEISFGIAPYTLIDNKVYLLVCKASRHSLYGFIKGKIEDNETEKECAIREAKEETNLDINIEHLENYFYQTYKRKNVGVFTIDLHNMDKDNKISFNGELYSVELKELNETLYKTFLKNQRKILNELFLYFSSKNIQLKSLFH